MRHASPLDGFVTLERELEALEADVPQPGAMLAQRLETVLTLVPVLGAAAQDPSFANQRTETLATLQRLRERQEALTAALRAEMARVREEIIQVSTGAAATRSYGAVPAGNPTLQLDRVG